MVKKALGGESAFFQWLEKSTICQCRDGKYCHTELTLFELPNDGAIRVCWHHDRLLLEGKLVAADFRNVARQNWLQFVAHCIRRDLRQPATHSLDLAHLFLWATSKNVLQALPDEPLRKLFSLPPKLDHAKESSIGFEQDPIHIAKTRLTVLNLKADDEPPLSFMRFPKPVTFKSAKWLRYVKSQPCVCCGRPADDPHHLINIGDGKMGSKAHDLFTLPLCRQHHNELHRNVAQFEMNYGSQQALLVAFLNRALSVEALSVG